jgi:hypothetical protein
MIQLCCVVDEPDAALSAGREVTPELTLLRIPRASCVVRPCETAEPPEDADHLVQHDRLLRRMMSVSTVVPFRYRTVLPTADDAASELEPRVEMFEELIERLRGRVELALRVAARAATVAASPAGDGRAYLRERARSSSALRRFHSTLAGHADGAHVSVDGNGATNSAYLVGAGEVDQFCDLAVRTVEGIGGLSDVSITGPWPPYTFAGGA